MPSTYRRGSRRAGGMSRCWFGGFAILRSRAPGRRGSDHPRLVRVAVLDDQRIDALGASASPGGIRWAHRSRTGTAHSGRGRGVEEAVDHVGRAGRMSSCPPAARCGRSRDESGATRWKRSSRQVDQLLILGRGGREPVQQEQRWRSRIAGLAVEHLDAIGVHRAIRGHRSSFLWRPARYGSRSDGPGGGLPEPFADVSNAAVPLHGCLGVPSAVSAARAVLRGSRG